jgi:hypothetical protein
MNDQSNSDNSSRLTNLFIEAGFDTDNLSTVNLIRAALRQVVDKGTSMDTGGGADSADMWLTIGGTEYYLNLRKSNAQLQREAGNPNETA